MATNHSKRYKRNRWVLTTTNHPVLRCDLLYLPPCSLYTKRTCKVQLWIWMWCIPAHISLQWMYAKLHRMRRTLLTVKCRQQFHATMLYMAKSDIHFLSINLLDIAYRVSPYSYQGMKYLMVLETSVFQLKRKITLSLLLIWCLD